MAGVMRRYLLEALPRAGFRRDGKARTPEDLEAAEEVFLTNALQRSTGYVPSALPPIIPAWPLSIFNVIPEDYP